MSLVSADFSQTQNWSQTQTDRHKHSWRLLLLPITKRSLSLKPFQLFTLGIVTAKGKKFWESPNGHEPDVLTDRMRLRIPAAKLLSFAGCLGSLFEMPWRSQTSQQEPLLLYNKRSHGLGIWCRSLLSFFLADETKRSRLGVHFRKYVWSVTQIGHHRMLFLKQGRPRSRRPVSQLGLR